MDFKQYLKESLTSLGEGASDIQRALIDFSKTYRPMYANEQVDEVLTPREKTPDLDRLAKGAMELPMVVGAPLTPRLPGIFRSTKNIEQPAMEAVSGWDFVGGLPTLPVKPRRSIKPVNKKDIEAGTDEIPDYRATEFTDTPRIDPTLQRELDLPDPDNYPHVYSRMEREQVPVDRLSDKYGLNYAYRNYPSLEPYTKKYRERGEPTNYNLSRQLRDLDLDHALGMLAKITGLPDEALGLRRELSLFPDRIPPNANASTLASFTPKNNSIHLRLNKDTLKSSDALGHEWFHALDRYLGAYFGKEAGTTLGPDGIPGPLSRSIKDDVSNHVDHTLRFGTMSRGHKYEFMEGNKLKEQSNLYDADLLDNKTFKAVTKKYVEHSLPNMRPELRDKWGDLMYYIYHPSWTRSLNTGKTSQKSRDYLTTPTERGARAFDAWLEYKNNNKQIPILTSSGYQKANEYFDHLPMKDGLRDDKFIRGMFNAFDNFFNEIRVRGATRSDGKKIVELFGGAAPFGMLAGMPDEQTQKKATPPKDITKGWTSPFDEEDKKFIDRPQDTLKEKRGPSKFWDDYWGTRN